MSNTTDEKKFAGLSTMRSFLNQLKNMFVTKDEVDEALAQKSQVQIITWEADD